MIDESLLIVTEQRKLPRFVDVMLTLLAWLVFVYLFLNGFISVLQAKPSAQGHGHFGLLVATFATLAMYFAIGIANALVLFSWALYNKWAHRVERRGPIADLTSEQLCRSFNLPVALLHTLRANQVSSVYHDEDGNIVGVSIGSVYAIDALQTQDVVSALPVRTSEVES